VAQGGWGASSLTGWPGGDAEGGALWSSGFLAVTNSTWASNQAAGGEAGVTPFHDPVAAGGSARGGALFAGSGTATLVNVTIAYNRADAATNWNDYIKGQSLGGGLSSGGGTIAVRNSIIAYSQTGGDVYNSVNDGGYNLCSDSSTSFTAPGSFNNIDPLLGNLANNGGPTATMMLLAGSLMGALTIFQKATGTLNNDYGGFAQAGGVFAVGQSWGKLALQIRPNGPIGEQNRFGQLLIVLVPLASLVVLRGKTFAARAGALTAGTLIVGGVVLTYSRGAFLGLIFMITLMVFMGYIKPSRAIPVGFIAVVAFLFTGPGFIKRLQTFEQVPALLSGKSTTGQSPDESMRRRLAENLAALEVLADHPLVGVGPAHFARFYSTAYVNRIGLAAQAKGYFAHNLYLEIAANTGLLGLAAFLIIVGVLMHELWSQWRRLRWSRPNAAYYSGAFFLSCAVYLMTGVFLQLAFQRYFWLLIAVASSAARAVAQDSAEPLPKEEDLSSSPEPLRTEPA
ncbi:MAG: O-antigen ligase family protein, partial [Acidobacteriia bacterium]|nr:O-antigen ligase family protein [Terriglobia bacterium]